MEERSVFTDKNNQPSLSDLMVALGSNYAYWERISQLIFSKYPQAISAWHYPGQKYGWNLRIKDKKRALIYLLPREGYFMVAFVFGDKAVAEIMKAPISPGIKTELQQARKYAEGRGIRIEVKDDSPLADVGQLIDIKLRN